MLAEHSQKKGYIRTNSVGEAEIIVFLSYRISDPITLEYSYTEPVYGQTIGSSKTKTTYDAFTNSTNSTTTYTPSFGKIGEVTKIGTRIVYERYIYLDAVDIEKSDEKKNLIYLWQTEIKSEGSSGDLRKVFPVLVAAAMPYIGTDTKKQVSVKIKEDNQSILEIMGVSPEK